jgi:hypothetical protein
MQHKRWQCKIIDAIDLTGNFDLPAKIGVDLDKYFDPQCPSLPGKRLDKDEGFRDHETTASGFFYSISNGIQSHHPNIILMECLQHRLHIRLPLRMVYIDIDLLFGKGCP